MNPPTVQTIGVNLLPLRFDGGGARFAAEGIIAAILKIAPDRRLVLFASRQSEPVCRALLERLDGGARTELVTVKNAMDIWAHADRFDVWWAPLNNFAPRLLCKPSVAFVLDIQDQVFPEYFSLDDREARDEVYRDICRAATLTATITEYSRGLILRHFGTPPDRLRVVHLAAQDLGAEAPVPELDAWAGGGRPFLLYPANFYPHKNHAVLLGLAEAARGRTDGGERLVLVGSPWQGHAGAREEIAARGLGGRILALENLASGQLRQLYRRAEAVVIPSKFEGFCMPALEAAAGGTPVVCAELPAVRELLGDAALYFPPDDLPALQAALARLRNEPGLRDRLVPAARARAARFTWENSARQTLALLDEAAVRHHRPAALVSGSAGLPGIALFVRLGRDPASALQTIASLRDAAADHARLRLVVGHTTTGLTAEISRALDALPQVERRALPERDEPLSAGELLALAGPGDDLVGELVAGDRLAPGALTGLAQAWREAPGRPAVLLGEAVAEDPTNPAARTVGYLRFRPQNLVEFSGPLFPAALFLAAEAARRDGLAGPLAALPAQDWQWEALRLAHAAGSLLAVRRTLARCPAGNQVRGDLWHRAAASLGARFTLDDVPPPSRLARLAGTVLKGLLGLRKRRR
jgi:glycosyltransferase involved in cell wall biosynthesis